MLINLSECSIGSSWAYDDAKRLHLLWVGYLEFLAGRDRALQITLRVSADFLVVFWLVFTDYRLLLILTLFSFDLWSKFLICCLYIVCETDWGIFVKLKSRLAERDLFSFFTSFGLTSRAASRGLSCLWVDGKLWTVVLVLLPSGVALVFFRRFLLSAESSNRSLLTSKLFCACRL